MNNDDQSLQDAVFKLTATVSKLADVVERLVNKDEDPDGALHTTAGEEEGWETVRNVKQDEQKETLDSWKDELNNLLVFAGLFSAVVTAFTVESYTWLQQDPGDASNRLLARISLQLSALTFGSTSLNSSSPALTLPEVQASFSPVPYAAHVNTLWVLSLALSLISAFFAIAVQQWLRQLRVPSDITVRKVVQVMEVRFDGLQTWQVPSIISLLPLLLQVAVVLFLVGLFLLLRTLNKTVAAAFGLVALIGLIAFLVTAVMPLITIHCPYKSPVVPTAAILLQTLSYPLVLAVTPAVLCFILIQEWIPAYWVLRIERRPEWTMGHLVQEYHRYGTRYNIPGDTNKVIRFVLAVLSRQYDLIPYIRAFGRHMFVDMNRFWPLREYSHIDSPSGIALEQASLISVLLAAPNRSFRKSLHCLYIDDSWRHESFFQDMVLHSLRAVVPALKRDDVFDVWGQLVPKMEPLIPKWLSHRHLRILRAAIHRRNWTLNGDVSVHDSQVLTLFRQLYRADIPLVKQDIKQLLHICSNQQVSDRFSPWEPVPVCLLLDMIMDSQYVFDSKNTDTILVIARRVFSRDWNTDHQAACRHVLAVGALALRVLRFSHDPRVESHVSSLAKFLSKAGTATTLKVMIQTHCKYPTSSPQHMSIVRIIGSLCNVLAKYSTAQLRLGTATRSLSHISAALREVCSVREIEGSAVNEYDPIILRARKDLDEVDRSVLDLCYSPGWDLLNEAWDGHLVALVAVEDEETTRMEPILEAAMEAFVLAERRLSESPVHGPLTSDDRLRQDSLSVGYRPHHESLVEAELDAAASPRTP